jgi:hypothetical protein
MIHLIDKSSYEIVEPLFENLNYQLFPQAVVTGLHDGDIYVDDVESPKSGILVVRGVWAYLGGDSGNVGFNQALNQALFDKSILAEDAWGMLIGCTPEWAEALTKILHPLVPVPMHRYHYRGRSANYNWRGNIPDGYTIQKIDKSLRERPELELPPDIDGLLKSWENITDPTQHGFGYVVFHEDDLVAHAVVDVVVGTMGDIGLVTEPTHRRRGLATILSAATIEYGFNHMGLTEILWDCMTTNPGSNRIAEKLGFDFINEHTMYVFDFDPAWNLVSLGMYHLDLGEYTASLDACNRALACNGEVPPMGYFIKACALAGLEDKNAAFKWFNTAIDQGWTAKYYTQERSEFKKWHDTVEWKNAIRRMT